MDSWEHYKEPRGCMDSLYWMELAWSGSDGVINWALPGLFGFHSNSYLSTHSGGRRQWYFPDSERSVPKAGILSWPPLPWVTCAVALALDCLGCLASCSFVCRLQF